MARLSQIVFFIMMASALARVVSIDSENEVTIQNLETVTLEITSNPSTGYSWTAKNPNSDRFFIKDLEGTYIRGQDMPGAPGKQHFEVSCNEKCQEGDSLELQFSLKRSWEPQPIRTKEVVLRSSRDSGLRLDKFLLKYSSFSWNHIQKLLRNPEFYIRGVKISKSYKLKENEELEFPLTVPLLVDNLHRNACSQRQTSSFDLEYFFTSRIIFEDHDLIVINKPAGLASQGGIKVKLSADQLADEYAGGKLMHRLDKDVSGLLVFGKSKEACSIPIVEKTYLAILTGTLPLSGHIKDSIKSSGKLQELSVCGKEACTYYERISSKTSEDKTVNLVRLKLGTGRKHQIRVHCSQSLSSPVLGDTKYGGLASSRIFLHSHSCIIKGEKLEASLPDDFSEKLEELGLKT